MLLRGADHSRFQEELGHYAASAACQYFPIHFPRQKHAQEVYVWHMQHRVARALVEYEIVWHASWLKGMDAALGGLACTLICQNPETGVPCRFLAIESL
jgi:hypothetical protein